MTPVETIEANRLTCELITVKLGAYGWKFDQYVNPNGHVMYRLKNLRSGMSATSNENDHPEDIAARLRAIINCGKEGIIRREDYAPFLQPV